jgi:hypothetical protein
MTGSIIGSFRKHYNYVKSIIDLFEEAGIIILSPKRSNILNPNVEFVIFHSDNPNYCPEEIQLIALHRILRSDFVYVCNPDVYVGRTTCYEIGRVVERKIPLFFNNVPEDLPIFIPQKSIITPESLVEYYLEHGKLPDLHGSLSTNFAEQLNKDLILGNYHE